MPAGGYFYARIFQDDTIDAADWFYNGAIVSASNLDPSKQPPDTAQAYDINRDGVNGDAIDDSTYGMQVVPEPATMALFGLGLAVLGLRKRRK